MSHRPITRSGPTRVVVPGVLAVAALVVAPVVTASAARGAPPAPTPAANAALDWLTRELDANDGSIPGFTEGSSDWGLTADAVLAFTAADRGEDPAAVTATDLLVANATAATTWAPSMPEVRVAGPTAKLLLLLRSMDRSPTANGVTVVIEFRELGGGVHVRCATGSVNSGLEALQRAGIDYRTTIRFPGFVCRIADRPANDPCVDASPATAYWSYWVAPRGGQWCYSNRGAGGRALPTPPADRSPAVLPAPTTPSEGSSQDAPGSDAVPDDEAPGDRPEDEPGDRDEPGSEVLDAAENGGDGASSTRTSTGRDDREVAGVEFGGTDRSGSPVPTVVAGVAIVALGGAAWWRRRRAGTR